MREYCPTLHLLCPSARCRRTPCSRLSGRFRLACAHPFKGRKSSVDLVDPEPEETHGVRCRGLGKSVPGKFASQGKPPLTTKSLSANSVYHGFRFSFARTSWPPGQPHEAGEPGGATVFERAWLQPCRSRASKSTGFSRRGMFLAISNHPARAEQAAERLQRESRKRQGTTSVQPTKPMEPALGFSPCSGQIQHSARKQTFSAPCGAPDSPAPSRRDFSIFGNGVDRKHTLKRLFPHPRGGSKSHLSLLNRGSRRRNFTRGPVRATPASPAGVVRAAPNHRAIGGSSREPERRLRPGQR